MFNGAPFVSYLTSMGLSEPSSTKTCPFGSTARAVLVDGTAREFWGTLHEVGAVAHMPDSWQAAVTLKTPPGKELSHWAFVTPAEHPVSPRESMISPSQQPPPVPGGGTHVPVPSQTAP